MTKPAPSLAQGWMRLGSRFLPFADAVTTELPLSRLLRLSLFQVSVGMSFVLLNGTLNRVMIVELGVPSWLVAAMVALPLVFAPLRVLIGFRSDHHRSVLGWRRVPYIWLGTMVQFGGLAIMPFALLLLSSPLPSQIIAGRIGVALAFLLVGAGLNTTQTVGLSLATDIAPEASRPSVVAFLYVMLMIGMIVSGLSFGVLLDNFSEMRLIQVIQGAAVTVVALNVVALWKQEARDPSRTSAQRERPLFRDSWHQFQDAGGSLRVLLVVGLGTLGFTMQDILLEPYGAQILNLTVSQTTVITAVFAGGMLAGFAISARSLRRGFDPYRMAAIGVTVGVVAFSAVIFSAPLMSPALYRIGAALIGFGGGLFAVGTLTAAMALAPNGSAGLALGIWGGVQATAAGLAIAGGGAIRDVMSALATEGHLGVALVSPATGYTIVYQIEIALLFATLAVIGPLVRWRHPVRQEKHKFGLVELPG